MISAENFVEFVVKFHIAVGSGAIIKYVFGNLIEQIGFGKHT